MNFGEYFKRYLRRFTEPPHYFDPHWTVDPFPAYTAEQERKKSNKLIDILSQAE